MKLMKMAINSSSNSGALNYFSDEYPNMYCAYGFTRISSFNESLVILRDADNETLTIEFPDNSVDSEVLLSDITNFINENGADTGYIQTLKDTTGNGRDIVFSLKSEMPVIVENGSVITRDGKLAAKAMGNVFGQVNFGEVVNQPISALGVFEVTDNAPNSSYLLMDGLNGIDRVAFFYARYHNGLLRDSAIAGNILSGGGYPPLDKINIHADSINGSDTELTYNNSGSTSGDAGLNGTRGITFGSNYVRSGGYFYGYFQSLIIWNYDYENDLDDIRDNRNLIFNAY